MKFNPFTQQLDFDTVTPVDTDGTMAANSDAVVPSQKAVVTYVGSALTSLASLKGAIDASANPNYPAAVAGDFYYISVAGKVGGASGAVVSVGDALIAKSNTAAGDQAAVGANWIILEANIPGITTVGNALATLPNPSAITFVRINADNTVTTRSASELRQDLGFTTVGTSFATLTNPSAITFPRINADNSVTARSASDYRTDLGATTTGSNLFTLADNATGIPQDYFYWLDAADATNGGSTWTSKEGKVFTSGTIVKTNSSINGLPTVNGASHYYDMPSGQSVDLQAGNTVFVVGIASSSGQANQRLVTQSVDSGFDWQISGGIISLYAPTTTTLATLNGGVNHSTIAVTTSTATLWTHSRSNTTVINRSYMSGSEIVGSVGTSSAATASFNRFAVGKLPQNGNDEIWAGQVAEVIYFSRHLSNVEYNAVASYLATKYGFTFTPLPEGADFFRRNSNNTITARVASDFRTDIGASTVGSNLFTLSDPSAVTFLRLNADNTATARSASDFRGDIGGTTVGSSVFTLTNPSAVTFLRMNADNTASTRSASDFRGDIGGTTVGSNVFTLTNPSAVSYLKINADNTVTARSDSEFRGDLGATTVGANLFTLTNPSAIRFLKINADNTVTARSAADFKTDLALPAEIGVALSDETTDITTGTAKITFRMPYAMTLTSVRASLATASSSGTPTVGINANGSSILSTDLTIDANEKTSVTATTAAVISTSALASDDEITMDIDVAGTGAKGLKVWLIGTRA